MPQMLTLSNGRPETILSPKDFEDLIDKHMGMDCANYYQNQIEQLSEATFAHAPTFRLSAERLSTIDFRL